MKEQNAAASRLASLLSSDGEVRERLSLPEIARYVYLSRFAENSSAGEVAVALQDIVDSKEGGKHDLFDLFNQRLADRLSDPRLAKEIRDAFRGKDSDLRPSKPRVWLFPLIWRIRQFLSCPSTLLRLRKMTAAAFSTDAMDRALFDYYAAFQLGLKEAQLRPWEKIAGGFSSVRPSQLKNTSAYLWVQMAFFAAEIEMPIHGYSTTSGDAFRAMLPSLSAYMGKTVDEEKAYDLANPDQSPSDRAFEFCTNIWCREETRHELTIQKVAEQVYGFPNSTTKTYPPAPPGDFSDPAYALKHLADRNCSEWHANSLYLYLRAHAEGAADRWIDNVRGDETKHMVIFSTAYKYFFGNQFNKRLKEVFRNTLALKKATGEKNSKRSALFALKGIPLLEVIATHFFIEKRIRDYLRSVPLKTLEKIFDSPLKTAPRVPSVALPGEKSALIREMSARERSNRAKLFRWRPREREKYLTLRRAEREHGPLIEKLISAQFDFFKGAEVHGSAREREVLRQIKSVQPGLDPKTNSLFRMSLRETLRDYQVMSNSFVRSRQDLAVTFKSPQAGFVVEDRAALENAQTSSKSYVCYCHSVERERLEAVIRAGAKTLEEIQELTLASTGCGECEISVREILERVDLS